MAVTENGESSRRRINYAWLFDFALELGIATVGATLLGILTAIALGIVTATLTRNSTGGNFGDHVMDQPVMFLLSQPYHVGIVLSGFALGVFRHRFFRSGAAYWVWIIPAGILVWNIFTWETDPSQPYWSDVWNNYFGSGCGGSECFYEQFVTVPFYSSLAYTFGSISSRWFRTGPDQPPRHD